MPFKKACLAAILACLLTAALDAQKPAKPAARKRAVQTEEYGRFENLGSPVLSRDGRWLATTISRVDGSVELRLCMLVTGEEQRFEQGAGPAFSRGGRWLGRVKRPTEKERKKLTKAKKPVRSDVILRDLKSGEEVTFEKVRRFAFSDDGRHVALLRYAAKGKKAADLVVRALDSGREVTFGNVRSWSWSDRGALLALVVATGDKLGNGVQLFDASSSTLRALDSSRQDYVSLSWRKDAPDLAVLRETEHDSKKDEEPSHVVLAWSGLDRGTPRPATFDHAREKSFPKGQRVVSHAGLRWSEDGRTLFFGIADWEKRPQPAKKKEAKSEKPAAGKKAADGGKGKQAAKKKAVAGKQQARKTKPRKTLRESLEDPAGVEVWHARDVDIIPRQKKTAGRDRNRSMLCAFWLDDGRFVPLAADPKDDVRLLETQKTALVTSNLPYERERMFGPVLFDVYTVDVRTGKRSKVLQRVKYLRGSSPDGRWFTFQRKGAIWSYDLRTGRQVDLTSGLKDDFINDERLTLTDEKPGYGSGGWLKDSSALLVYSRYDIWEVAPDGSRARPITRGAKDRIRYRRLVLDRDEDRFVDPARPLYLSAFGDLSKRSGFAQLSLKDLKLTRPVWKDRSVGRLAKARDADVYVYSEQDFDRSPEVYVAGPKLAGGRRVVETNAFCKDYLWGRSELVEYVNANGEKLQGALAYPAGWEKGKRYPMIVYIYEKRSQNLHRFTVPSERRPYNPSVFTSEGYFVLQPDIVYRPQNPGLSAVECVVPAVKKILATGMVDAKRVGLVGHSWGAYQTAFIVTQTDVFAAGVAGAPLTNMMSMSMSIYWNTGGTDARIFHESQGRMDRPFWRDVDTYIKNSPIFNIESLNTPLLVAFGDKDGAVDWHQGIEMYNAARLAKRPMVMLVYPGENHGLRKKPNQVDYHWRVREWFDHYLRGKPAPKWITEGQSHLEREKELEAFKKRLKENKKKGSKKDEKGASRPAKKPKVRALPSGLSAIVMTRGRKLWERGLCTKCHGATGRGGSRAPDLTDDLWLHTDGSVKGIRKVIVKGVSRKQLKQERPFPMNPIGSRLRLTGDELQALATYVWSLSHAARGN